MKLIIAGGRDFNDYPLMREKLNFYLRYIKEEIIILNGKASGADYYGGKYAKEWDYKQIDFPAAWEDITTPGAVIRYKANGKPYNARAGNDRNKLMAENATHLVAFWDGKSTGTKDMIDIANKVKLNIKVVRY